MLTSSKGNVLRCDVNGKIVMKVFLSGMPDVKLGLNDKLEVCPSCCNPDWYLPVRNAAVALSPVAWRILCPICISLA